MHADHNTDSGRCKDGQNMRAQEEPWRLLADKDSRISGTKKNDQSETISLLYGLEGCLFLLVF